MQHYSADQVKNALISSIDSLLERRKDFLTNPSSDFTRVKKICFQKTILFPMIAGSDNVATELLDLFGEDNLPLPSAMVQRRNQIKPEAFKEVFSCFTKQIPIRNKFHGYQLVACDGSRINLPYNPSDPDTFIQCIEGRKGINQVHLNALYDPLNDLFLDAILQGIHEMDEKGALVSLLNRHANAEHKRIYICDRGYASYNIFANAIHNHQLFLIRVPESFVKNLCPSSEHWMNGSSADEQISINIGRRNTKKLHELENYHYLSKSRHYDYLAAGSDDTDCLQIRVLKFKISENSYEYIVTNFPKCAFPLPCIKELYAIRWSQETAFRHLKYAGNMVHIHSLKKEFLIQEIYGKLTLYNFSAWLSSAVCVREKIVKHEYVVNHTQMQKICIRFLRGVVRDVKALISRYLVPVRPGRKFERCLRRQSADTLAYR